MIFVSHVLPANEPGEPALSRSDVWAGLVLKANNALPFVPSMTFCEVTDRISDTVFDRDIDFRGQRFTERITMEEPHRVTFTRIAGPVLGTIANEIEGPDDDLRLRFSFALVVAGVEGGSKAEQEYADSMTGDTRAAVADLRPWLGQGVYFNMLNVDELDRVVEALSAARRSTQGSAGSRPQYDPENLFRANYNITPVPTG